jgi:hypothetical protein
MAADAAPTTIFPDEFLERLPLDPVESLSSICQQFELHVGSTLTMNAPDASSKHRMMVEAFALLRVIEHNNIGRLPIDLELPELTADTDRDQDLIVAAFNRIAAKVRPLVKQQALRKKFDRSKDRYATMIGFVFVYQFESEEIAHAQRMVRRIAEAIHASALLEADHHVRILRRLRQLSNALTPVMTTLDIVHGCIIDIGTTLTRFGSRSQRFAEPLRDIALMIANSERRAFGLPPVSAGRSFLRLDASDETP